ncbi:MAG: HNH endonuclease [Rhodobacteraceae bacterium]|nr:HNH endonuclease [Paracoccaceae bacterium]
MVNAVFIQNPESIYDDRPGLAYHFPLIYLRRVEQAAGDWVIFYEGKRGAKGYVGIQRVASIAPDPAREDHFYAFLDLSTRWDFERIVPRADPTGSAWEKSLRGTDGRPMTGGANAAAVRLLSFAEFTAIVTAGLEPLETPEALPREAPLPDHPGFADPHTPFAPAALQEFRPDVLVSRAARDASFARMVRAAYKGRCAISGLDLRNGGGRAEVQAAHIRPVHADGPDTVQNGLALSGTVHWMFDRGLIAVGAQHEILVSENKVAPEVRQRLICPGGRLHLPENPRHHPHPEFLRWHRENVFGAAA